MQVQKNTVVTLRYVMKNDHGEVMEDNMKGSPIQYVHGRGNFLHSLESAIEGLAAGDNKTFTIQEKQLNTSLTFDLVIDDLRMATGEEIITGRVKQDECGPDCNC